MESIYVLPDSFIAVFVVKRMSVSHFHAGDTLEPIFKCGLRYCFVNHVWKVFTIIIWISNKKIYSNWLED